MPVGLPARVRTAVRRVLMSRGYRLQRVAPHDARGSEESPRDLVLRHAATLRRDLLVEVPVARCRSATGVALDERHPFVATLTGGPPISFEGSALEVYYRHCQPASVAEVLGVPERQAPGLASLLPTAFVMPWHDPEPEALQRLRAQWMAEEAARCGRDLTVRDGLSLFGPVSREKGEMEVERLTRLYRSMEESGFRRHGGREDIEGWVLTEGTGAWCLLVRAGQHRVSVAAALGHASVPVRLRHAPVERETVMRWPQVRAGRITPAGALAVFDRVMRGDPPSALQFSRRAA